MERLGEQLEDPLAGLRGHTDAGIGDFQPYSRGRSVARIHARDPDIDAPVLGELHGVAGEVHEDLAHPHLVATDEERHARVDMDFELEPLAFDLMAQHVGRVLDQRVQVEVDLLGLDLAGLDPGDVEHM